MAVYRSRNALAGPLTSSGVRELALPRTRLGRRGYRPEDVDALLHRLAHEVGERSRRLDLLEQENQRLKQALRTWQSRLGRRATR
ncbi:DivIVA domain-containing protein [Micromonospora citrea]|uniref:DivIVA domain-containing protein n=1 Tax=Micromonospora citrea TaxID=47855 RepID=A0A1C6VRX7_9ACTN|nr:DivIVA domain-containing protein [Micromonospora citrea]SCL69081.1 DivIVA domain-containing protein [Micromonospora citrea]